MHGGSFYIKTYHCYVRDNALAVYRNTTADFHPDSPVIPCKAELHIIEKGVRDINDNN